MNPLIFGIDFDGTCVTHEFPNIGKDIGWKIRENLIWVKSSFVMAKRGVDPFIAVLEVLGYVLTLLG